MKTFQNNFTNLIELIAFNTLANLRELITINNLTEESKQI